MRLFIGIELPPPAKDALATLAAECRREIERTVRRAVIRWVPAENLHITLWFLGETDEDRLPDLEEALKRAWATPRFPALVQGLGTYPPSGGLRVIWAGLAGGRQQLVELHGALAQRLPPLGFEAERRAYSPHVTLARVKDIRGPDAVAVRSVLARRDGQVAAFDVEAVTLFRSVTLPQGSRYEALLRVPLI